MINKIKSEECEVFSRAFLDKSMVYDDEFGVLCQLDVLSHLTLMSNCS